MSHLQVRIKKGRGKLRKRYCVSAYDPSKKNRTKRTKGGGLLKRVGAYAMGGCFVKKAKAEARAAAMRGGKKRFRKGRRR